MLGVAVRDLRGLTATDFEQRSAFNVGLEVLIGEGK